MYFRGFDTSAYPGDETMAEARKLFDVTGYYLRAPSHPDQSWLGKREHLASLGFGFLPIFVGQQEVGPGSHLVTADQGALDGAAAALRLAGEGFAKGSKVFVDLENGPPFGGQQAGYVGALLDACDAEGMVGAVYASHAMAPALLTWRPDLANGRLWLFRVPTVAKTSGNPPFIAPNPALSGASCVVAWQYRQNVVVEALGDLLVDLNTADRPDPSAPG